MLTPLRVSRFLSSARSQEAYIRYCVAALLNSRTQVVRGLWTGNIGQPNVYCAERAVTSIDKIKRRCTE